MKRHYNARWSDVLSEAITKPGRMHECFHAFHNYSIGNCILAAIQCHAAGLPLGPLATYNGWKAKGRQVRGGQQALFLWMPFTGKRLIEEVDGTSKTVPMTYFRFVPKWFVLAQTDGEEYQVPDFGDWQFDRALEILGIKQKPYTLPDGNIQGYAEERTFAVNPIAASPAWTALHETAHVVLGHAGEGRVLDGVRLGRDVIEVEAEGTAYVVADALGLNDEAERSASRGYIQDWLAGQELSDTSARRIFSAADRILRAGHEQAVEAQAVSIPQEVEA